MNLNLILTSFLMLGLASGAYAGGPMLKPMAKEELKVEAKANDADATVLIEEDFARMDAGTEDAPDSEYIASKTTGEIPSKYTIIPGWSGACIYQAGGACAILKGLFSNGFGGSVEDTGFLRTPQGSYAGDITLTFRAKLFNSAKTSDKMDVALLTSTRRLESKQVDVTPQWKTFTLSFTEGEFTGCLIQFAMISEEVIVDDIKVTAVATAIPAPEAYEVTNFTRDGFTASWSATKEAESYLLNLYEKKVDDAITIEDFDDLNVIPGTKFLDTSNPGFSEGWNFVYGLTRNKDHVSDLGYQGSTGMVFRATGEGFSTPIYERPIRDFSIYARYPSGEPCLSTLVVTVLVDGQWGALGNYDVERISTDGEILHLSNNFPESGVNAVQIAFKKNENDGGKDVDVIIDHIRIMTYPENEAVETDIPVNDRKYTFTGLDPEKDYAFTVRAKNANFQSRESNEVMALGLVPPVVLPATDISNDSYQANWESAPKADGYIVNNYRVYTVTQPSERVNILHETFDKVTTGTLSNPTGLYNVVNPRSLDEYTENPGWLGIATYLINGMLGTRTYYVVQGMIQTPVLDLSGNNGKFDVHVKVLGDTDAIDELLVVQAGMSSYQRQAIKPGEIVELDFSFNGGTSQMPLAFYSYHGFPFYLDEVTVTQTLPSGTKVYYEIEDRLIEGSDASSTVFNDLHHGASENYAYRVFSYRDFMGERRYSISDSAVHVDSEASVETVNDLTAETPTVYFTIDGIRLKDEPKSPGIFIRKCNGKSEKFIIR